MSKWMNLAVRLLTVVIMFGAYIAATAGTDVNDPNKKEPNAPAKMSCQKDGMHNLNCRDANDPNKPREKKGE